MLKNSSNKTLSASFRKCFIFLSKLGAFKEREEESESYNSLNRITKEQTKQKRTVLTLQ